MFCSLSLVQNIVDSQTTILHQQIHCIFFVFCIYNFKKLLLLKQMIIKTTANKFEEIKVMEVCNVYSVILNQLKPSKQSMQKLLACKI